MYKLYIQFLSCMTNDEPSVPRHLKFGMVGCFICQHISYKCRNVEYYEHCDSTNISCNKKEKNHILKA